MQTNSGINVLLVDDEPANLLALEVVLEPLGANLVRAGSGEDALRRLQDADYAAILMDVRMPGMDGFEAAKLIRSLRRSRTTPIIFVTADGSELSIEEAYAMGAVDFLTKPLMPAVIKAKVAFFIELQRGKDELRAAERRATQERAFLAAVLEAIEDGVVACDAEGRLTLFNRATRSFHGLPQEGLLPDQWADRYSLFREDGRTRLPLPEIPLARALAGELVTDSRMVIAPELGPVRTVVASGRPLYDEEGTKLGAVVSMHDITAVREVEAAREAVVREQARREEAEAAAGVIAASKERVRMATEAGGLGVWVWETATDKVVWEHDWLYDLFGLTKGSEPINGARFLAEFVHPDDAQAFSMAAAATIERGEPFHFVGRIFRHPDHELRWLEFRGNRQVSSGNVPLRILGTAADITERHRFQEQLRASEERYRTLFNSIDQGFALIELEFDGSGRTVGYVFLEVNPAFAKHTGLVANPVGRRITEVMPGVEDYWIETYGQVALTGTPVRFINEAKALNRWFDAYATRLGGPGSRTVALLFSDITDRKRADDNLRRLADELAESDRRKTEFLATLAHELRNPLAPLSNGLQMMRLSVTDPVALEKTRSMMERQITHMVHLVDDLLDIARITTGKVELKKEQVDLQTIIASAVETSMPLIEAGRHELQISLPDEVLLLEVDLTRVAQVVGNLLNNAAKYTPARGRIKLSARSEGNQVAIAVSDTGIGIPAAALPTVFEMFTQVGRNMERAQGGLGIGLSLVRRLVELHGGSVSAASDGVDRGSTFTVKLPLLIADAPVMAIAAPAAGSEAGTDAGLRVLVVDDNVDAADTLAALLEMGGHVTHVANDGYMAIEVAQAFRPQVVFLDIGLPGMNGYEVARKLRQTPGVNGAILVALTGWGTREDRQRSSEAGFDHHLTKPADISAVEELLASLAPVH